MRLIFKWLYLVAILSQSCKARYASAYSDNVDLVLFITYYYIDTDEIPGFFHLLKKSYLHRAQRRYYFNLSRLKILVSPW